MYAASSSENKVPEGDCPSDKRASLNCKECQQSEIWLSEPDKIGPYVSGQRVQHASLRSKQ
jgi:hypothetical protein